MESHAEGTRGTIEWRGLRLSWGAILAGLVIATVVQVILSLLGIAIGFGTLQFDQTGAALESLGIGAGIWAVVSALISLFLGGLAAGHLAGSVRRLDGILHGTLVWGLSLILTLWALGAGVGTLLGGVFGVAGQTLSAGVTAATQVGVAVVQPGQMPAMVPQDREQMVSAIQEQTDLTRPQAEQAADAAMQAQQQVQLGAERVRERAPEVATQVAGAVSTAAWWALLAAIVSLLAAMGGALVTAEE